MTQEVMRVRNIAFLHGCVLCGQPVEETALHLFMQCPYALQVWNLVMTSTGNHMWQQGDSLPHIFLTNIPHVQYGTWISHIIAGCYLIWRERNTSL